MEVMDGTGALAEAVWYENMYTECYWRLRVEMAVMVVTRPCMLMFLFSVRNHSCLELLDLVNSDIPLVQQWSITVL